MAFDAEQRALPESDTFEEIPESIRELAAFALGQETSPSKDQDDDSLDEATIDWRVETDPTDKVEGFLETNAHLFGAVTESWRDVSAAQGNYLSFASTGITGLGRQERRQRSRQLGALGDPRATVGLMRVQSQTTAKEIAGGHVLRGENLPVVLADVNRLIGQSKENKDDSLINTFPEPVRTHLFELERLGYEVFSTRVRSLIVQETALNELDDLLDDEGAAPVMLERIRTMASTSTNNHAEYPGFLELVATHVQQEGPANMLHAAYRKSAPNVSTYAKDFLAHQLADGSNEHKRKELSAAFGVMSLMSSLVERDFEVPAGRLHEAFAEQVDAWPVELRNELQLFAANRTNAAWERTKAALTPFIREGRMHVEGVQTTLQVPQNTGASGPQKRGAAPAGAMRAKSGKSRGGLSLATTSLEVDHNALLDPTERQPISKFGILVNTGRKSERYTYEEVDTLEELFELSNLGDYVEKYRSDPSMKPMLMSALEHLTKNPFDPSCTRRLHFGRYTLETDGVASPHNARRFSPQHLPGIRKGTPTAKTRIFYDVANEDGQQRLLMYGAFLKQDIETFTTLPRR